ncbi:carbamoyl-phosphate synthase L chain, ATP binding domain-containing protein [Lipomyces doorenjongii]
MSAADYSNAADSTTVSTMQRMREQTEILGSMNKVLVANRGEIPIRIFRTARELSMQTVAVYSYEDRLSMHRQSVSDRKRCQYTPVQAYLQMDEIIKIAKEHNVSMIHPGYGFLSENSEFARKVEKAGIAWVGPPHHVIDALGDKVSARKIAIQNRVPVVPGTPGPVSELSEAQAFVEKYGFPVIIKAAFGGGGRGMRVVPEGDDIKDAFLRASSEAKAAFGNGIVFIERFLDKPKNIEVQLLGDGDGNVVHFFERDCSVQRRHQKVVEIAPAKDLLKSVRDAILKDAVKLAASVRYRNAGTAEFLVDSQNRHYFIEINPRIQVEHTITEEITGIDIVAAQIQIAAGATLAQLGLTQDHIFRRVDTGKIEVYRSAGGNGVRLDGGNGIAGAIITPFYDSMLVKCTCSGSTDEIARRKTLRALIEFRIRGVKTNIPFLLALLTHETFVAGNCWTTFIDDTPELFDMMVSQNRAQKLLAYLGDLAVNGSSIKGQIGDLSSRLRLSCQFLRTLLVNHFPQPSPARRDGVTSILSRAPRPFAKAVRDYKGTLIMDTTWRDAHQSLLATRVRTVDFANIAIPTSYAYFNAFSLECWVGATFDVAMRFLYEDPWDRLRKLRALVPNIPFQMLLRGANGAKKDGVDIFRVFDALNDLEQLKVGVDAARKAGGIVEATICYSGDMLNPEKKYNLKYYLDVVDKFVAMGTHILGIKDMAGTMKPQAATILIGTIREKYPDLPIHVHTHDSAVTGVASMVAAAKAGADVVDVATNSMSGMTSQPSVIALLATLQGAIDTCLNVDHIREIDSYWAQIRLLYSVFEADLKGPDPDVYVHEIPGGQLTNLLFQAQQLGLGTQWLETKRAYVDANKLLGDLVKVTPTSKVVGDLAQFMVSNKLSPDDVVARATELDFPDSVLDFFQGKTLAPIDFAAVRKDLEKKYGLIKESDVASYVMYPKVYKDYQAFVKTYGDLSVLPTRYFLSRPEIGEEFNVEIEMGKILIFKLLAIGPLSMHTGQREVFFELNGEIGQVTVDDKLASVETVSRPKADPNNPSHVGAPMSGVVVEVRVKDGSIVKKGDPIAVLSAMKMEMVISAQASGLVSEVVVREGDC